MCIFLLTYWWLFPHYLCKCPEENECPGMLLMISQHWFRQWLGKRSATPYGVTRPQWLTHWSRVTHICVKKNKSIVGSGNGLSADRCPAVIWTNVRISLIWFLGTDFIEIVIKIRTFSIKKCISHVVCKWEAFCLSQVDVLTDCSLVTPYGVTELAQHWSG